MALSASEAINQAAAEILDPNKITHSASEYLAAFNAAILQIAVVRPDAVAVTEVVTFSPGTKQAIPAGGMRFLRPRRNMGSDGATPGEPIKMASFEDIERYDPRWHSRSGSTKIKNIVFDDVDPKTYYTYPPVHASKTVQGEIVYSKAPAWLSSDTETMPVDDVYLGPAKEWIKYLILSKETSSMSKQIALQHRNNFYAALDVKLRADMMVSPNMAGGNK